MYHILGVLVSLFFGFREKAMALYHIQKSQETSIKSQSHATRKLQKKKKIDMKIEDERKFDTILSLTIWYGVCVCVYNSIFINNI